MADFEAARLICNRITGDAMSKHTFRRLQIPYRLMGRTRRYEVGVVVDCAKRSISEALAEKARASPRQARHLRSNTWGLKPTTELRQPVSGLFQASFGETHSEKSP